jgi:hypothetical protein
MRAAVFLWVCISAWGQTPGDEISPVVRGAVLRRDAGVKSGEIRLLAPGDRVLRFRFDSQTYVERDNRAIDAAQLKTGEQVEVVSEAVPGAPLRAARTIHVLRPPIATPHRVRPVLEMPKGDLTYAGLVLRLTDSRLVLHRRDEDDVEILLRPDTRFMDNGETVAAGNLKPNMRVSVRGAKNVAGKVEAYQVVWGSMLQPN